MREELLDVLDSNGIKTGEILPRKEVHKKGLWHRIIVVAIVNEKNEVLIQQRSENKDKNPGMWDISVTGHLSAGQDSLTAATREISEEVSVSLGYSVEVRDFRFMFSYRKEEKVNDDHYDRQFYDFFILRQNGLTADNIRFQAEEVQAIKFVSINELNKMREEGKLVNRDECYDELAAYLFRI
ncbi:MAG: NUDIX domain-containing protein [Clostridia bacterium]|jgi:isopentenyl-diphosphate delta-isomerase|nr:NUDIX domain-containing protein [Clostridia bacterium]